MVELQAKGDDSLQERVLRAYTVLRLLRESWGGVLILCCGLGPQGAALAMAANIAGAVCLSVEEEPELLKEALRSGSCDFIVNTLDEALRAMKNEARKHLPISVGLQGEPSKMLQECCERGVQPEILVDLTPELHSGSAFLISSIERLRRQGATVVSFKEHPTYEGSLEAFAALDSFTQDRHWTMRSFAAKDMAELRIFDAHVLRLLANEDTLRRQWLRSASRIVQRQRPLRRALWVTVEEEQILDAIASRIV